MGSRFGSFVYQPGEQLGAGLGRTQWHLWIQSSEVEASQVQGPGPIQATLSGKNLEPEEAGVASILLQINPHKTTSCPQSVRPCLRLLKAYNSWLVSRVPWEAAVERGSSST